MYEEKCRSLTGCIRQSGELCESVLRCMKEISRASGCTVIKSYVWQSSSFFYISFQIFVCQFWDLWRGYAIYGNIWNDVYDNSKTCFDGWGGEGVTAFLRIPYDTPPSIFPELRVFLPVNYWFASCSFIPIILHWHTLQFNLSSLTPRPADRSYGCVFFSLLSRNHGNLFHKFVKIGLKKRSCSNERTKSVVH